MMTDLYRFLSLHVWGNLPASWQRALSQLYAGIYNQPWTRHVIPAYSRVHYKDPSYLDLFSPASGASTYQSFQDFFTRRYQELPQIKSKAAWPCEGLICDYGIIDQLDQINIKGEKKEVRVIFGRSQNEIPSDYYFTNVFLHNNNYHRIHAPVTGEILDIEHIRGELVLLRPWVYKNDPSLPALRNERVNVTLKDGEGRKWYVSIVGGPAVGTILLDENTQVGNTVNQIQELGTFLLGSTCCIASPLPISRSVGETVYMGEEY
ncbi:MAG: phosphatidylserine decarboxylase [Cyclobacteriaceae bacterium]